MPVTTMSNGKWIPLEQIMGLILRLHIQVKAVRYRKQVTHLHTVLIEAYDTVINFLTLCLQSIIIHLNYVT